VIPEGFATLYAFLGLVTPGLVYQLLRERARPALEETSFREASRVALTSAVLTTAAILTIALVSRLQPAWVVDVDTWIEQGTSYLGSNTTLVAWTVVATVTLACVYALVAHVAANVLGSRSKTRIENTDVWYQLLVEDVPKGQVPWVAIKTEKGTWIWGHVDFFTVGKSLDDREISLKGPELAIEESGDASPKTEHYWRRICVRASEIAIMKVTYEPKKEEPRRRGTPRLAVRQPSDRADPATASASETTGSRS
jgi:hypothetical protein